MLSKIGTLSKRNALYSAVKYLLHVSKIHFAKKKLTKS